MGGLGVLFGLPVGGRQRTIIKPADQTGTGTVAVTDSDLFLETDPNSVYMIDLSLIGTASGTAFMLYDYIHSGTTTYFLTQLFHSSAGHTESTLQSGVAVGHVMYQGTMAVQCGHSVSTTTHAGLHSKAILQTGGSGGLFEIRFSSNAIGVNAIIKAGSYMRVRGLSV